jgi:hypothetical protein
VTKITNLEEEFALEVGSQYPLEDEFVESSEGVGLQTVERRPEHDLKKRQKEIFLHCNGGEDNHYFSISLLPPQPPRHDTSLHPSLPILFSLAAS